MKNKINWLLCAALFSTYVLNAQNYTVDCDGDGVMDACSVDECPPCSKLKPNPSSPGMKCCGGVEYDPKPTTFTPTQWNIDEIKNLYNNAKSALTKIGPCNSNGGGSPSFNIQVAYFKSCCEDVVVDLEEYKGNVSWDLGSISCDWPIFGIPYTASANITAGAGLDITITASGKQTCKETNVCFKGSTNFSLGGGVSATVAAGVIRVSATLVSNTTAEISYCLESEIEGSVCVSSLDVVGTAELAFISKSISFNLYSGGC